MGYTFLSGSGGGSDPTKVDKYSTASRTSSFTASPGVIYLIDTTSGPVTATFPAANSAGQQVIFKWVAGTNTATIQRAGTDTIGASATTANLALLNEIWEFTSSGSGQWNLTGGNKTLTSLDARFAPMLPSDHGLIAWSVPIDYASATSLMSVLGAGVGALTMIRRLPACTITNLHCLLTAAGVSLSNCYAALYTSGGALLGQTADQSTAWQSIGFKTMPLTGGPLAFAGGNVYVQLWYNGTTAPSVLRSGLGSANAPTVGQSSGNFNAATSGTGLTTTAASNLGTQSASNIRFWAAVS